MGTGLVPIHLLAIIVQIQIVSEGHRYTVRAPVTFDLVVPGVHPDRRAASCHQDLCSHETLLPVYQIPDVVRAFHPVVSCLLTLLSCFFFSDHLRAGDAVRNVCAHPAKLLFACLPVPVPGSL